MKQAMNCRSLKLTQKFILLLATTLSAFNTNSYAKISSTTNLSLVDAKIPPNYIYTESNIATPLGNSILAYRTLDDGTLQPLMGSPFLTGGAGFVDPSFSLGPFDSDQNIIVNPTHTLLFAVNSGSNSIAVFHIANDGSLTPVQGSPFYSEGVQPVSLGYEDGILVVVNKHGDPAQNTDKSLPNYTTFRLNDDGTLTHISQSTIEVAAGSSPSQALVHAGLVFGADFLGGMIESFSLDSGYLYQKTPLTLPDSEFAGINAPHVPLGLAVNPIAPVLYVGYPTVSKVGVYSYDMNGNLTFLQTVSNSGKAVCWFKSNATGSRLYTANAGDHSLSVYDTSDPYHPFEIQRLVLNAEGGLYQFALDPSETMLYILEQRDHASIPMGMGNALHVLSIDPSTGKLAEINSDMIQLQLPGDTRPEGMAVF